MRRLKQSKIGMLGDEGGGLMCLASSESLLSVSSSEEDEEYMSSMGLPFGLPDCDGTNGVAYGFSIVETGLLNQHLETWIEKFTNVRSYLMSQ